ncbi:colicin-like pore-forming protein [Pseudocitrobacter cyperus]|uniref:Colicin-like pore-forming protein n=1 Tax=Pseudocitrobacter cyperus TaxID=3112843 RepID=A0ABV0HMC1_9ENTR
MPGFNYGGGSGDGTSWSSERGTEPDPGGGSKSGGGRNSGGNINLDISVLKAGDSLKTPLGIIIINSRGQPTMNGIVMTPDNSSLITIAPGHLARVLNSLLEKNRKQDNIYLTKKDEAVSKFSVDYIGIIESIQNGVFPTGYSLKDGKVGSMQPYYTTTRGGHGDHSRFLAGTRFTEEPVLTAAYKLGKIQLKDAVKFTSDFYQELTSRLGKAAGNYAKDLEKNVNGKKIRSVEQALSAITKYENLLGTKFNAKDRKAIATALESVHYEELAVKLAKYSKVFKYTSSMIDAYDTYRELITALKTNSWRPFFIKVESLVVGKAATGVAAFLMASITGIPIGLIGFAFIMALVGALVDDSMINSLNKKLGI